MNTDFSAVNRRQFLSHLALATLATASARTFAASADSWAGMPIAIFEKVFEGLSYDELADAMAQIGADGVEATIRPGGHITPAAAADETPKMAAAMKRRGKRIVIAATHIRRADEAHAESNLRTFKALGITHYRMGHFSYDLAKPLQPQLTNFQAQISDLAALNKSVGIQGLYQNHSGSGYVGALAWDAAALLEGVDPDALGLAFDTRHLVKDTGSSWKTAVAAVRPHIRSIYVKDGLWHGPRGDQYKDVPLDTGFVNAAVFNEMRRGVAPAPLCIHMEWLGYRVFKKDEIPSAIEACKRDTTTLRRWLDA